MAAESGTRTARRRFRWLTWEEGGTKRLGPPPPAAEACRVPGETRLPLQSFCRKSRLPETISIFIFLGNFTAFISGKIKAVIAGEMIPIRA